MATHHWIIICGIKHHVQVGITAGCGRVDHVEEMRMVMVMLMKTITAAMIPLPMALRRHRERGGEGLPLVLPPPWPPPRWGEVLPLVLGLHGDDGPSVFLLHGLR